MTKLLDSGFVDTFRYLYPDATGRYSWWSYMFNARANNAGWRIDYFLVSDRINPRVFPWRPWRWTGRVTPRFWPFRFWLPETRL